MKNMYEVVFFIKANISIEKVNVFVNKVCSVVESQKGKNIYIKVIERKKLWWPVRKQNFGTLVYHQYISSPQAIKQYNTYFKSSEICILNQTILMKKDVDIDAFTEDTKNIHEVYSGSVDDDFKNILSNE
jgi:ribosomal protein S6